MRFFYLRTKPELGSRSALQGDRAFPSDVTEANKVDLEAGAISRKAAATPWWGWVILAMVVGVFMLWLAHRAITNPWQFAAYAAGSVVLGGLGVLSAFSPRVGESFDVVFSFYLRITLWFAFFCVPILIAWALSEFVADSSLFVAVLVLLAWTAIFYRLVRELSTEERRDRMWRALSHIGRLAPFIYAAAVAQIGIVLFATLAFVLADREVVVFGAEHSAIQLDEPADALDFFAWHALDAVPALEITGTLRWEEPLGYDQAGVGLLVLIFKAAVIAPIVASLISFWRYRRKAKQEPTRAQAPRPPAQVTAADPQPNP